MMKAFLGVYLMQVDIDDWNHDWMDFGFDFDVIPIFYILDDWGEWTGEAITGGAWDDNIPENMAPVLDKFFHDR